MDKDFYFGNGFIIKSKKFFWNPDKAINPHVMIWGTSGSGKSWLLRELVKYLKERNKHIHVVDIAGDLEVEGENLLTFTSINSPYGINIFEFDNTIKGGGPKTQISEIIEIFRKSFMPNLGAMQENVLRRLLSDTYLLKGLTPNDPKSWEELSEDELLQKLPTVSNLKELVDDLISSLESGIDIDMNRKVQRLGNKLNKWLQQKKELQEDIKHLEDSKGKEKLKLKIEEITRKINETREEAIEAFAEFFDRKYLMSAKGDTTRTKDMIDYDFYNNKEVLKVLKTLQIYINTLYDSGAFCDRLPPVRPGLNRYNISTLDRNVQIMFTEILLSRVVNKTRKRGEYKNLPDSYRHKRGEKVDSFIIIDEAKNIMPTGKEKESSKFGINKGASESRKYGLGIIAVSQSPIDFTQTFIRNAGTKIGLKVEAIDQPIVKNFCGIKEKSLFEHSQKFGVALINTVSGNYESVELQWMKG